jgi:phosphopantothenoylcysteine decarboxylase/phosphopantothenate--cysteine ligase
MLGKTVLLGVSGGIAAYKAAALCSTLSQRGVEVHVIMTRSATEFIRPLTFQTLSRHPVAIDTFEERDASVVSHIDLADRADLVVVAPATANMIAKMANGIGDDMLTTTLLATQAPVLMAPAMNVHMYDHPAVCENLNKLRERGVYFVEPGEGQLACGYVGKGRLAEPDEIVKRIEELLNPERPLVGKKVLVTAGPTREAIDPVRYLSNYSSGKMGYAIAEQAREMGAEVVLVSGPTNLPAPVGIERISVTSTRQMYDAVIAHFPTTDIVIKAAAVADYRPAVILPQKIKKKDEALVLTLEKTEDILSALGQQKTHQWVVGFAAETENVIENARGKLERKNLDMIVANDVSHEGAGFDTETNIVTIINRDDTTESLPLQSKRDVAKNLLRQIAENIELKKGKNL